MYYFCRIMTKQFIGILLLTIFISNFSFAQFTISGNVLGQNEKGLSNIKMTITTKDANNPIEDISDDNGAFRIIVPAAGKYLVTINEAGYQVFSKPVFVNKNIENLTLQLQTATKIEGVKVVADKPVSKFSVDKKTYNVGQDITASGGSASDVLKNVPSLTVDPVDGGVAIRGNENILILVDGKPSTLLGTDVATILQGIPASSIESVEVINNPGAQYDAQGKGGVLNIILKKDRKAGYNGNVGVNIGLPARANINVGFNANVKKWNLFGNASGRTSKTFIKEYIDRKSLQNDSTIYTNSLTSRNPLNGFINIGADYTHNKYNKFTLSQNAFAAYMQGDVATNIHWDTSYTKRIQNVQRTNDYTGMPRNTTTSFNYTHTSKLPGEELKVDASLGFSRYTRSSDFRTDTFDAKNAEISKNNLQSIPVDGGNTNFTISSDYARPLNKNSSINVGLKMIQFRFHSENFPTANKLGNTPVADAALKNKFNYTQQTYASYANYKMQYKTYSLQAGLRFENFVYDGFVYQYNKPLQASFSNFFPSVYVSKKLPKESDLTLSYTKRVNRPNFFQMVPYIDVTNPQDTSQGNPDLLPEFIHASELSYNKVFNGKNSFLASVYYQFNDNLIQRYKRFNPNGTTFTQPQNINEGTTYGAELNVKYYFSKNWDASANVNIFNNKINGQNIDATIATQGWSGFAKIISNYKLNTNWDFQLTGNYQAPAVVAQGRTESFYNVDVAIKTTLLKKSLTLSLSANDIFNTTYLGSIYEVKPIFYQYNYKKSQTQQITIGAQYRFMSKNMNPADAKERKMGRRGGDKEVKDMKNRDDNLKKDERDDEKDAPNATPAATPK
jgi:iron complex outermembrane recepter protein